MLKKFLKDSCGAAAIEYALIITLATLGIIAGATSIGQSSAKPMNDVSDCLEGTNC